LCLARAGHAQGTTGPRFSGDFRVRYERTTEGNGLPAFDREVVRFRIGMSYSPREDITIRARLATGDPNDPNSTDITLTNFLNDLTMSLDAASVEVVRPRWAAFAGKFFNPLQSTELVWDGDVNPQGVAARVMVGDKASITGTLTGIYSIIVQQANDSTSDMAGGQVTVATPAGKKWKVSGSAGYYDYHLRSVATADAGDFRGNRLDVNGAYLSDFNLLDVLVAVDYTGLSERYPLRLVADYVHNSGADDLNTGWGADVFLGRASRPGDLRFRYGYGVAETDAILAAFSHDNITLGTNYENHTLTVDAVPITNLFLNATVYYYRPHEAAVRDYQTRVRLNAMVAF
jgi:hypothetical protein